MPRPPFGHELSSVTGRASRWAAGRAAAPPVGLRGELRVQRRPYGPLWGRRESIGVRALWRARTCSVLVGAGVVNFVGGLQLAVDGGRARREACRKIFKRAVPERVWSISLHLRVVSVRCRSIGLVTKPNGFNFLRAFPVPFGSA